MAAGKYTIVFESKTGRRKLFKLWFGSDGSYYVTVPYHPARKAVLLKQTINYETSVPRSVNGGQWLPVEQAIDIASADDARIKLSHHPDGFLQFSGSGLVSGKNPDGSAKGIGIQSWPLTQGCRGPAFGVTISGVDDFEPADSGNGSLCVFRESDLTLIPGMGPLLIEGHFFPTMWRRFVQTHADGTKTIPIMHPAGVVLQLRVLLPADKCPIGGFFGLEVFGNLGTFAGSLTESGFALSSSTGNVRQNEQGQKVGDGLFCFYPRPEGIPVRRSVDYAQGAQGSAESEFAPDCGGIT
jgi:hypothetical protein